MDRVARWKGATSEIVNIFVAVEGGTLWRKNKFSNKSLTMPKNWKGDPLGFLNTQCGVKHQRNWKGDPLERNELEKCPTMPKNWKGDTLWFFNIHFLAKLQKIEEGIIFVFRKNLTVPRKPKEGPFGIFQHPFCRKTAKKLVCYAGKQEKLVQFATPSSASWCNNI